MARLHDVPSVLRSLGPYAFAKRVWNEILDDHLFMFAGSLAYAWLFAIFPFFIFLLNLLPFLPAQTLTPEDVRVFLLAMLPDQAAETLLTSMGATINNALAHRRGGVLSLSLVVALWAASGGIAVTMAALDKCYEIDRPRAYYKRRPMAFLLTGAVAGLACTVVLLLPVGAAFKQWVFRQAWAADISYWTIWLFDILRGGLAIAAAFLFLSLIYHFGPSVRHKYRTVTPGAAFTLVCWVLVGLAFRAYMGRFGNKYNETYGAVGGVAILLLLFYVDAVVLLIGAEINSEIDYAVLNVPRGTQNLRRAEEGRWGSRWRRRKAALKEPAHPDAARAASLAPAAAATSPRNCAESE